MKGIEIKTAQNVLLEYELASLRDRILAFLLDLVFIALGMFALSLIFFVAFRYSYAMNMIGKVLMSIFFFFYSLAFETFNNGQSPGKKIMRIKVITITGEKAVFYDYVARWVFRPIDIYFSAGSIASMLITSSSKAQRIGDIVGNTTVIRLTPSVYLYLNDILKIQSRETYQPVYMQAKQLVEEDVILIKSAIDRYKKYDNDAHFDALGQLVSRIRTILEIREAPTDNVKFLQTIINDYIVLTR